MRRLVYVLGFPCTTLVILVINKSLIYTFYEERTTKKKISRNFFFKNVRLVLRVMSLKCGTEDLILGNTILIKYYWLSRGRSE